MGDVSFRTTRINKLDAGIVNEDITLLVGKVRALALKMTDSRLARYGLDLRHYSILHALETDSAPSQRELADYLNLEPRRAMSLLDSMETRGLVSRRTDPADRRSNLIEMTEKGAETLAQCRVIVKAAEDEYLNVLEPEQVDQLREFLVAVARPPFLDEYEEN